jgi:hypothetical protein
LVFGENAGKEHDEQEFSEDGKRVLLEYFSLVNYLVLAIFPFATP